MHRRRTVLLPVVTGAALLLACLMGGARLSSRALADASAWVEHANRVLFQLDRIELALAAADDGAREFVLRRDSVALAPLDSAVVRVPGALLDLRRLTADDPFQQHLLDSAMMVAQRHLSQVTVAVTAVTADRQAVLAELTGGLESARALGELFERMRMHEQALLDGRVHRQRDEVARLDLALGLAALVGFALAAAAFQAERRVRRGFAEQASSFRSLAEHLPTAVARFDRDRRLRYANAAFLLRCGTDADGVLGRRCADVPWPASDVAVDDALAEVFATGSFCSWMGGTGAGESAQEYALWLVPERDGTGRITSAVLLVVDVGAERRAERARHAGAESLRAIAAATGAHLLRVDREQRYLFVNDVAARAIGRPPAEILGRTAVEVGVDPASIAVMRSALERLFATGERQLVPLTAPLPGGTVYLLACCEPERDETGRIASAAIVVSDVTAERLAAEALEAERAARYAAAETLRTLAEAGDAYIARYGRDHRWLFINDVMARQFHRTPAELVGLTPREAGVDPAAYEQFARVLDGVFETGQPATEQFSGPTSTGIRHLLIALRPEKDAAGHVTSVVAVATDVSELHRTREALERERDLHRVTLEQMSDHVVIYDEHGRATLINAAAQAFFAAHPETAPADGARRTPPRMLWPDGVTPMSWHDMPLARALRGEEVREREWVAPGADGRRSIVLTSARPLRAADGRLLGAVVISRDVTALRHAEAERDAQDAQARLLQMLVNAADLYVIQVDREDRIRFVNDALAARMGWRPAEVIGRTQLEAGLPPEPMEQLGPALRRVFEHGRVESVHISRPTPGGWQHRFATLVPQIGIDGSARTVTIMTADETPLREAEHALQRERTLMAAMLDQMSNGLIACDAAGRPTVFNRAVRELTHGPLGTELPDDVGLWYRVYEADGETLVPHERLPILRTLRGEVVEDVELVIAPHQGPQRIVLTSGRQLRDRNGELLGAIVVLRDITAQRRVERERDAQMASARLLKLVTDASGTHIFRMDRARRWLYVNDALARDFQRTPEELVGRTPLEVDVDPGEYAMVAAGLERAFATGLPQSVPLTLRREGGTRHMLVALTPERDGRDEIASLIGVVSDITDAREAELAREAERQLLLTVLDQMQEELVVANPAGDVVLASGMAREELASPSPRARDRHGLPWGDGDEPLGPGHEVLQSALRGERVVNREVVLAGTGPAARQLLVNAGPLRGPAGDVIGAVAVSRDVSDYRALQDELQKARRMEATGRMAAGVAHDFNNMLMSVRMSLDLLRLCSQQPELEPYLGAMEQGLARGAALTGQMLAFSRGRPTRPQPVRVGPWLRAAELLVRHGMPAAITVEVTAAPDVEEIVVEIDPVQFEQALLNLTRNARDAMPAGGTLRVWARVVAIGRPAAPATGGVAPGPYLALAVEDDGIGMEPGVLEHLFEPFFSTKISGLGNGLGLSTAHGIVTEARGAITVESAPGRGSRFTILLPLRTDPFGEPAAPPPVSPAVVEDRPVILVVDDDPPVRRAMAMALERAGHTVLEAGSGAAALEVMERQGDRVRLLVCDVRMPGMSGIDCVQRLAERGVRRPVVFVTGYLDVDVPGTWLGDPLYQFLEKPVPLAILTEAVAGMLAPRRG